MAAATVKAEYLRWNRSTAASARRYRDQAPGLRVSSRVAGWLGAALMLVACASKGLAPPPSATSATPAGKASRANAGAANREVVDPVDPALERQLAEFLRLHDWRSTVFVTGMPSGEPIVHPKLKIAKRAKLARPAQVRAYVWRDQSCATQSPFGMPFEANGTLCEGVVGGSVLLDERERDAVAALALSADAELVKIAAHQQSARPRLRCDFDPHQAFVFFDEQGEPIARIKLCFDCKQILWEPSSRPELLRKDEPPAMTSEELSTFGSIFDQHGLGAWAFDPDSAKRSRVRAYEAAVYGSEPLTARALARRSARRALPPPVDRDVSPKRATSQDRARLCAWFQDQFESNGLQMRSTGYECANGRQYALNLNEGECPHSIARCDVPTRRIEDCLRTFAKGPEAVCALEFQAACSGLRACVPGLARFSGGPGSESPF